MKDFFKDKTNLILTILLVLILSAIGFLTYSFFKPDTNIYAINFNGYTDFEIKEWCSDNKIPDKCILNYEYNNNVEENTVIYQSISEGGVIDENITFTISKGKEIVYITPFELKPDSIKDDIDKWAKENNIKYVEYIDEYNDEIEKDNIISIIPNKEITIDSKIVVNVSLGKKENNLNTIYIEKGKYVDISVDDFEETAKKLNLSAKYTNEYDDYSSNIEKGKIIWHGSGEYEENETFRYSLSLGKDPKGEEFEIKKDQFIKLTEDEIKQKAEELGLVAVHNSDWDDYSDTVEKGLVVRNGCGFYTKNENLRYGLSLGKKQEIVYPISITKEQYAKFTVKEFEEKAKELGLTFEHNPDWDDYSDTIEKGLIIRNGSGDYEKGELFRYGLSLGKKNSSTNVFITIEKGQYLNLTEDEFKTKASELGLNPVHNQSWDDYSSTVAKGKIVMHGFADNYIKGEDFRYGLSLGQNEETKKVNITVNQYVGKTVQEFEKAMNDLGLKVVYSNSDDNYSSSIAKGNILIHGSGEYNLGSTITYSKSLGVNPKVSVPNGLEGKSEQEFINVVSALELIPYKASSDYSSTIKEGSIISYDKGSFNKGTTINYTLSLGVKKIHLLGYNDICSTLEKTSYSQTETSIKDYLNKQGFTNISFSGNTSFDYGEGKVLSIKVNSQNWGNSGGDLYPDAAISIVICTGNPN